jgi:class 3 adenylate cyclase/tetratricopeptide (TPR) repeat protein
MVECPNCGAQNPERARFCLACGHPLPGAVPAQGEVRKTVTVVFCDVVESTPLGERLDAETYRRVISRYHEEAKAILERHGGSVEKFIGDAVMAVFGIPTRHDDDALRAVRAASDMRVALAVLNEELVRNWDVQLGTRTGINTGEVVAGDSTAGHAFAAGDAVNVAQRLEAAARSGEILLGRETHRLVENAVLAEPVEPMTLKGKAEPIRPWRLLAVLSEAAPFARRLDAPLVGRKDELAQLREALDEVVRERTCRRVTVVGPAGIGKSRLTNELFDGAYEQATVLIGHCLPYGEGITYWPLRDIIRSAAGDLTLSAIESLLEGDEDAERIANRVAAAIGITPGTEAPEETFWATRRLLEHLAQARPLILALDDLQWADETFLDLIEYLAGWTGDAPLLTLCLARPELLERRPSWLVGPDSTSIRLEPLSQEESEELLDVLRGDAEVSPDVLAAIAAAAEGNPLFVEQMLAMIKETGDSTGELTIPPTIHALLAARLDRLEPEERALIERASVIGREFWRGAVVHLSPEEERSSVSTHLITLVRKELIRPYRSIFRWDDGFRFRHILIRDEAYIGIAKETRADLHERFAAWLEGTARERTTDIDEILGYHLEQAFRYRRELGPIDEAGRRLATRAGERLAAAGRRALARGDARAASSLLARATTLVPQETPGREDLLVLLGGALVIAGEFPRAEAALGEAVETSAAAGNRRTELHALLERNFLRALTDPVGGGPELRRATEQALPELEQLGDNLGLAKTWRRIADVHWLQNHWDEQQVALEKAIAHARLAGDEREAAVSLMRLPMALYYGRIAARDARPRAEEILEQAHGARMVESSARVCLAGLEAMSGRFGDARELLARGRGIAEELGLRVWIGGYSLLANDIEMLVGDPAAAEKELRRGYAILEEIGERGVLARVAAALARALFEQGQDDEAARFAEQSAALGSADVASQISLQAVRGRLAARRGDIEAAETFVQDALRLAAATDDTNQHARVLLDHAHIFELRGRTDDAVGAVQQAVSLFDQKGNVVSAEAARGLLPTLAKPR